MSDEAFARYTDPDTSHEAAQETDTNRLYTLILGLLNEHGGLTTVEMADLAGVGRDSLSPRMRQMVSKNWVEDSGERRKVHTGRKCIVWQVKSPTSPLAEASSAPSPSSATPPPSGT